MAKHNFIVFSYIICTTEQDVQRLTVTVVQLVATISNHQRDAITVGADDGTAAC